MGVKMRRQSATRKSGKATTGAPSQYRWRSAQGLLHRRDQALTFIRSVHRCSLNDYRLKPVGSGATESRGTRLKPSKAFPAESQLKARGAGGKLSDQIASTLCHLSAQDLLTVLGDSHQVILDVAHRVPA